MAMNMTEYLAEELVMTGLSPEGKTETLELMVDNLVATGRLGADRRDPLIKKLLEREDLSSTGIGGSVAIPHASGENVDSIQVVMAQLPDGVDFESIDGEPVHLVFMIVGSDRSPRTHLQLLAMIVRLCKNREMVEKLKSATDRSEAYKIVTSDEQG